MSKRKAPYADIHTLRNIVTWQYLTERCFLEAEIAKIIGTNPGRLLKWVRARGEGFEREVAEHPEDAKVIIRYLEERYTGRAEDPPPPPQAANKPPQFEHRAVAKLLHKGLSPHEISAALHAPPPEFLKWYQLNLVHINTRLNELTGR